ncbi:MAG: hypothetical protein LC745_10920, partial [Planctomycetia bacterium]|nr:hypothetical protein [Planctomycetia bacterium]
MTLTCRLNKDVKSARLVDAEGREVALTPQGGGAAHAYKATVTLNDPKRYRVRLVDPEGRTNKLPAELVVNVTRNRPATVKMSRPAHDVRVSPVEELTLKAQAEDDYGVVRHGLSYSVAGHEPSEVVLGGSGPKVKSVKAEHMLALESFKAEPDQLVTYFFWAEDVGPDGKPRRSSGDMFFAEVRHFEEIFRQGEAPPGGESAENENEQDQGNTRQAEKLAERQKEIIYGTWTLIRRETGAKPSDKFADDGKLLAGSQRSAVEQAEQLGKKLTDPASKASLEQGIRSMKGAEKHLGEAVKALSIAPFQPALASEQAAYQALLKLRAREFEVIRNNQRQRRQYSRSSAGSPSQGQLDQLELSNEENRYEAQRTARAQQEKQSQREREQGETRQVVNRLKELARRQTDLNDRLKELQSALEAAKDQAARDEIERHLKRLRDQEQEILRDTDELRERMEREENRDRMAEARQQVEQSRDRVRQASEALEQNRLPQALTEGTRAGRELNDLREQLRKTASDRFSEDLTDMRGQARRLDETQKQLTEQLDAWKDRPERSLRESPERTQVREGMGEQGK